MSDMPMRLKYLTKMKIILCIFLLYITAVSVFGQSVELNGIVGKSIEFPAAVKIDGSWMYSGVTIGDMISGRFTAPHSEKFNGRVQWDSSTGFFSLAGLKMEDIGEYKVQNTHQNINTVFQLNVYEGNVPVLKPHLNVTHNEYPCTLLCAAARGTGVTLTLYKNSEKNPYVTSPVRSYPHLDITETVESSTYTCEAKNSVSRQTSDPLTVEAHCTAPSGLSAGTIAAIIIVVLIVALIAVVLAVLYRRIRSKHAVTGSELEGTRSKLEVIGSELDGTRSKLEALISVIEVDKILDEEDPRAHVTKSELEGIRREHANTKSELEVTKRILEGIRKEHANTKSELEDTTSKLEDTTSKLEVTRSELEVTRSELEVTRSKLEVTRSELEVTRSKLEGIRREHAGIRREHADTKSELKVTRSELEDTKSELKGLRGPSEWKK